MFKRIAVVLALGWGCGGAPVANSGKAGAPDHPATPAPAAPAAVAVSTAAEPALDLPAEVLPPRGTLMIGDMHGTREIPAVVGRIAAAAVARQPVVVALELPTDISADVAGFLASDGSAERRRALLAGAWWQERYQDGRRSVAMADLLESLRALRAAGQPIEVVLIDPGGTEQETREDGMTRNVIAARRAHPDAAMIVFAGNSHTSKHEQPYRPGFAWMAMRVVAAGIPLTSLFARWEDGTSWTCPDTDAARCGVRFLLGRPGSSGIHPERAGEQDPYDGWLGVGAITASPPAGFPDKIAGIDAQIAAAWASPDAVALRARRDAKRQAK
jgi:hypothetical protein